MKFIIIFAVCLAVVSAKMSAEVKQWKEECAKEQNIDLAAFKGKKGEKPEITNSFKCFKRCIAIKGGVLDESTGEVNYDKVKEIFKLDDATIENIKTCTSTAEDACDKYFEMERCGRKFIHKQRKGH